MGTGAQDVTEALSVGGTTLPAESPVTASLESSGLGGSDPWETDSPLMRIPVEIDVLIPIREFRVSNLLSLEAG
jgi:hypothetical protein